MTQESHEESVENALFNEESVLDEAFAPAPTGNKPEPQAEGSAVEMGDTNFAPPPQSNEEVRYQYWQSQADKTHNENEQLKKTVEILQDTISRKPEAQPEEPSEPEPEPFRAPPERPQKPSGFSRADAWDDPQSTSAQYMDAMDRYSDERDQYQSDLLSHEREQIQAERDDIVARQRAQQEAYEAEARAKEQMDGIRNQIKSQYNASEEDISGFVETMSSPDSISIDNLWRLYQMDKGQVPQNPVNKPSPEFNQVKRAQSVPSPMGVQPGVNSNVESRNAEDIVMDDLIRDYERKNPW